MAWILIGLALATALNVGASSAAAAIGAACGGGILGRKASLPLAGVCMFVGAALAGRAVTSTIGGRLVAPGQMIRADSAIILGVVALFLWAAFSFRIPLSTSQVTTGAVIGIGLIRGQVNWGLFGWIVYWWVALPVLAYLLSLGMQRWLYGPVLSAVNHRPGAGPGLRALTIACTCYQAFSAGASNAANSAGPLYAAGLLAAGTATTVSGAILAVGAVVMGWRLVASISTDITSLCLVRASLSAASTASLLLFGSLCGIPCSMVQLTAGSIAAARSGRDTGSTQHLRRLCRGWLVGLFGAACLAAVCGLIIPA